MGIVAAKPANKGAQATAETVERRPMTNGNSQGQSTGRTQSRATVTQAAERIRQFVKREPQEKLTALLHHVTPEALRVAYYALKREAAPGVDGMTWREYETGLEVRLHDLHRRVHTGAYRATPVRRVNIDKPDGGTRPLGVAALEDKIVQKAVVDVILTPIYEEEFLGISYGFRPGRHTMRWTHWPTPSTRPGTGMNTSGLLGVPHYEQASPAVPRSTSCTTASYGPARKPPVGQRLGDRLGAHR